MVKSQRFWEGSLWNFLGAVYQKIMNYSLHLFIVKLFGVEPYGLFAISFSIFKVLTKIGLFGTEKGSVYFISKFKISSERENIVISIRFLLLFFLLFGSFLSLIMFIFSPLLSFSFFKKPLLEIFIWGFSIGFPFFLLTEGWGWATRGFQTMKFYIIFTSILRPTFQLLFLFILFLYLKNFIAIPFSYTLSSFFCFLIFFIVFLKAFPDMFSPKIEKRFIKAFLFFTFPILFAELSGEAMRWVDIIMLGFFKGSKDVGIYNAAERTAEFLLISLWIFEPVFSPICAKAIHEGNKTLLNESFHTTLILSFMFAFPFFFIFLLRGEEILSFLFLPEFKKAKIVLNILSVAFFIMILQGPFSLVLTMSGFQALWARFVFSGFILNIILNGIFIPIMGTKGAAIATAFSLSALAISSFFLALRKTFLRLSLKLFYFLIGEIILFLLTYLFHKVLPMGFKFTLLLLALTYLLSFLTILSNSQFRSYFLKRFKREEMEEF